MSCGLKCVRREINSEEKRERRERGERERREREERERERDRERERERQRRKRAWGERILDDSLPHVLCAHASGCVCVCVFAGEESQSPGAVNDRAERS